MKLFQNKLLVLSLCAIAIAAGVLAGKFYQNGGLQTAPQNVTVFSSPRALPKFSLVDHQGQIFNNQRLEGHWSIVFFGFTHCPDVCPTTLSMLASTRKLIEKNSPGAQAPEIYMFSVDPERDTVEKIAGYVPFFDPSFVGVTGSVEAIESLTKSLGVAHSRSADDKGSYTIDHTSALFLINPAGHWVAISSAPHRPEVLSSDFIVLSES